MKVEDRHSSVNPVHRGNGHWLSYRWHFVWNTALLLKVAFSGRKWEDRENACHSGEETGYNLSASKYITSTL